MMTDSLIRVFMKETNYRFPLSVSIGPSGKSLVVDVVGMPMMVTHSDRVAGFVVNVLNEAFRDMASRSTDRGLSPF